MIKRAGLLALTMILALFMFSCIDEFTELFDSLDRMVNNNEYTVTTAETTAGTVRDTMSVTPESIAGLPIVEIVTGSETEPPVIIPEDTTEQISGQTEVIFVSVSEKVEINSYYLNLRTSPVVNDDNSNVAVFLEKGTILDRNGISDDGKWSRILYAGQTLYASSSYLSVIHEDATTFVTTEKVLEKMPMVNLESDYYVLVGHELSFETAEFVTNLSNDMYFEFACDRDWNFKTSKNGFAVTPNAVGSCNVTMNIRQKLSGNTVCAYNIKINAVNKTEKSIKGLIIGDSRISDGRIVEYVRSTFSSNLELIGTVGGKHEGRGAWTTEHYLNVGTVVMRDGNGNILAGYPKTNPFYNSATGQFDFGYYLNNNGFSCPDFVIINLGANDGCYPAAVDNLARITDNILAYCKSIGKKIAVLIMTEYLSPNADYTYDASSWTGRQFDFYRYQTSRFSGRENEGVYLIPNCVTVNATTDRPSGDTIHLSGSGYTKEAEMLCAYISKIFG